MAEIQVVQALGKTLKAKRDEMGISLKEAENATSIRMHYLQAIEEGNVMEVLSPVFAQGFLRQYATFLGIDCDAVVREHPEIFQRGQKQEFAYGIGTLETRANPGSAVKWVPNAFMLAGFAVMLIVAWYLARYLEVI